jgi:hypothetical protein
MMMTPSPTTSRWHPRPRTMTIPTTPVLMMTPTSTPTMTPTMTPNKNWLPSSALVTTADWKPDTLRVALATVSCESYSKRCRNRCGVESVERGELKRRSRCVRGSPCGLSLRSESAVAGSTVRER